MVKDPVELLLNEYRYRESHTLGAIACLENNPAYLSAVPVDRDAWQAGWEEARFRLKQLRALVNTIPATS